MARSMVRAAGLTVLAAALAAPLAGQGSSVYNQSACASARAGAAVATPCRDASSVYYNPGLLALMPSAVSAGFSAIYNKGTFTYDTTGMVVERDPAVPIVPQAYLSYRFGPDQRLAGGLGFWAPYGLGIEWPDDFEGRYVSWKTALRGLYLQPTLSYQVIPGKLAIGGGPQVVFGGIEVNRYLDAPVLSDQLAALGIPLNTPVAQAQLEGDGVGIGGAVGLYYEVSERFAIGARYMLPVTVDLEGTADFEVVSQPGVIATVPDPANPGEFINVPLDNLVAPQFAPGGPLEDQSAEASLEFPPQAVVGVRIGATPELAISADYQWTGWSTFDEINAQFENDGGLDLVLNYEDTHTYRTGLTFTATPQVEVRGGFIYNTAATPDQTVTPILPEAERQIYTAGFGYDAGRFQADVYYNYINQADRRGRVRSELPPTFVDEPPEQLNIGVYSTQAHLVGLTLSYVFGDAR